MSSLTEGDTVEYLHMQLEQLIKDGRGQEQLWVDVGAPDEPATLYAGTDDDADSIANVGIN